MGLRIRIASIVAPHSRKAITIARGMDIDFQVKQLCEPIRPTPAEMDRNTRCRSSQVHGM